MKFGLILLVVLAGVGIPIQVAMNNKLREFQRFLTNEFQHSQPPWFYGPIALAGALPWTAFLLPALARARSLRPRLSQQDSLLALGWAWLAVPLLFFSLSGAKLPGYILPAFPALALLLGIEAQRAWSGEQVEGSRQGSGQSTRWLRVATALTSLVLVGCGLAVALYLRRVGGALPGSGGTLQGSTAIAGWLPLAVALGTGGLLLWSGMKSGRARWSVLTPGLVTASIVPAAAVAMPGVGGSMSLKPLSLEVARGLRPGEEIVFYRRNRAYRRRPRKPPALAGG